jgi:hypothetical protein
MKETKTFTAKCDICGESVAPATSQQALNRNMGVHKRAKHAVKGLFSGNRGNTKLEQDRKRERQRQYQKRYRIMKKNRKAVVEPNHLVEPCRLESCPSCGCRFYIAKGTV